MITKKIINIYNLNDCVKVTKMFINNTDVNDINR